MLSAGFRAASCPDIDDVGLRGIAGWGFLHIPSFIRTAEYEKNGHESDKNNRYALARPVSQSD